MLYSNGCDMYNGRHQTVINNTVIPQGYVRSFCPLGAPQLQGGLLLPQPGNDSVFYYFHIELDEVYPDTTDLFPLAPLHLYYMVIHYPRGAYARIVQKRQVAIADTLGRCGIQAVRHANGRDWWVLMPKSHSNCYYRVLVTPQGVENRGLTCAGTVWGEADGQGQCSFSHQGDLYMRHGPYDGVHIFPFDRCTGTLSSPVVLHIADSTYTTGGVCTAPSGRFLYATIGRALWQFDLHAPDIFASGVLLAQTDGWVDDANFPDSFWLLQLAPDGKIYVGGVGNFKYLHVIHQPDSAGLACRAEKHSVKLLSYCFVGMPTFPNFRLGAFKGSACDTLLVSSASTEPLSTYGAAFTISPNPVQAVLHVRSAEGVVQEGGRWQIRDVQGRVWSTGSLTTSPLQLSVENLPAGMYFWYATDVQGRQTAAIRWVKSE